MEAFGERFYCGRSADLQSCLTCYGCLRSMESREDKGVGGGEGEGKGGWGEEEGRRVFERGRETGRQADRESERERERDRQTDRQREPSEREPARERQTDRHRQTDRVVLSHHSQRLSNFPPQPVSVPFIAFLL